VRECLFSDESTVQQQLSTCKHFVDSMTLTQHRLWNTLQVSWHGVPAYQ